MKGVESFKFGFICPEPSITNEFWGENTLDQRWISPMFTPKTTWNLCGELPTIDEFFVLRTTYHSWITDGFCAENRQLAMDFVPRSNYCQLICAENQLSLIDVCRKQLIISRFCAEKDLSPMQFVPSTTYHQWMLCRESPIINRFCAENYLSLIHFVPSTTYHH